MYFFVFWVVGYIFVDPNCFAWFDRQFDGICTIKHMIVFIIDQLLPLLLILVISDVQLHGGRRFRIIYSEQFLVCTLLVSERNFAVRPEQLEFRLDIPPLPGSDLVGEQSEIPSWGRRRQFVEVHESAEGDDEDDDPGGGNDAA